MRGFSGDDERVGPCPLQIDPPPSPGIRAPVPAGEGRLVVHVHPPRRGHACPRRRRSGHDDDVVFRKRIDLSKRIPVQLLCCELQKMPGEQRHAETPPSEESPRKVRVKLLRAAFLCGEIDVEYVPQVAGGESFFVGIHSGVSCVTGRCIVRPVNLYFCAFASICFRKVMPRSVNARPSGQTLWNIPR